MVVAENYYCGKHDILKRERTVIGEGGKLTIVDNLPNNRIVDNQYKKLVDQKNNYLLGNPLTIQVDNEVYSKLIKKILNRKFMKILKNMGEDTLNHGLSWLYIYYHDSELAFKKISACEIIPFWLDDEHTMLEYAIRVYNDTENIEKVELYTSEGIYYFELSSTSILEPVAPFFQNYIKINGLDYNWNRIPLIPFKYNNKEISLLKNVKSLQDGLNILESNFQNQMEEDSRNTIMVLVNYDGENLGEFRQNLATYGAIKVNNHDGAGGDVRTLKIEFNAEHYQIILEIFKKAMIENAMGYDAKDDRLSGNANQMNILSMYSDIDLDANNTEMEFQASFEDLFWFINVHLSNKNLGDFSNETVDIIFNRDILMNESEIIDNCVKSLAFLSEETVIANHPWIVDAQSEMDKLKNQREQELDNYNQAFNYDNNDGIENE